jgi:hypothetical protein
MFVPQHLYKEIDEAREISELLQKLTEKGVHGVILPPLQFPRDSRNLKTLSAIAPPGFFLLFSGYAGPHEIQQSVKNENFSQIIDYSLDIEETLQSSVRNGLHTTLSITEDVYITDIEAITLANKIASLIDTVGGCDFIRLHSKKQGSAETAVAVCEELIYLDVAGPTIKSRLLVESMNADVLEETMFAGVNKYIVDDESQVEMIESVAAEQGKIILK